MYVSQWAFMAIGVICVNALPNAGNTKTTDDADSDLPDNWDQTKDNQSLFQNKDAKNDLEPYPLAVIDTAPMPLKPDYNRRPYSIGMDHEVRRKRGGGTKVGGAGAGATKVATKNNGGKKNFRPLMEANRAKRDSTGLTSADVRALLAMWEAQERRKQEQSRLAERYYLGDEDQQEFDDDNEVWLNEPVPVNEYQPSYFSEQNRFAQGYPQRQYYGDRAKRFMVARKRSEGQLQYRPREDLYTLAELLRTGPRRDEGPRYRRHVM